METRLGVIAQTEKVSEHLKKSWARVLKVPPGFILLGGVVIGGLLVAAVSWRDMPGLVGVLVGAAVSAVGASIIALEARRVQLAATTWAKRLEVHQEAFSLWHQCWSVVHEQNQDKKYEVLKKAEDWWFNNCLYLSEDVRNSFKRMTMCVHMHSEILEMGRGKPKEEGWAKEVNDNWDLIVSTGQTIIRRSGSHISDGVIKRLRLGPPDPYGSEVQKKPVN
jgi:hypothetical protein